MLIWLNEIAQMYRIELALIMSLCENSFHARFIRSFSGSELLLQVLFAMYEGDLHLKMLGDMFGDPLRGVNRTVLSASTPE